MDVSSPGRRWGWGPGYSVSYRFVTEFTTRTMGTTDYSIDPIVENSNPFPPGTKNEIRAGMNSWSDVTDVRFYETTDPDADILIGSYSNMSALGRAITAFGYGANTQYFYGMIQFNGGYSWSLGGTPGTYKVRNVACHESGHIVGLGHTINSTQIMYYSYNVNLTQPGSEDTYYVQTLYKAKLPFLGGSQQQPSPITLSIDAASVQQTGSSTSSPVLNHEIQSAALNSSTLLDEGDGNGTFLANCPGWEIRDKPTGGTDYAYHAISDSYTNYQIVPTDAPIATGNAVLSYNYSICHTVGENEILEVWISTDGLSYSLLREYKTQTCSSTSSFTMETETIPLSGYSGGPVFLRFVYKLRGSHYTGDSGVWVDNVRFNNVMDGSWTDALTGIAGNATSANLPMSKDSKFRIRATYAGGNGSYSTPYLVNLGAQPGDFDESGDLDGPDMFVLMNQWFLTSGAGSFNADCDLNDDDRVDMLDWLFFIQSK